MGFTVFLADDHQLLLDGLTAILTEAGVTVVGTTVTTDGLVDKALALKPDVMLLDIRFDHDPRAKTGLDVCSELLSRNPNAHIVMYSQFDNPSMVRDIYKRGALAYVRKDESPDIIFEALKTAAGGRRYYTPEGAAILGEVPGIG